MLKTESSQAVITNTAFKILMPLLTCRYISLSRYKIDLFAGVEVFNIVNL